MIGGTLEVCLALVFFVIILIVVNIDNLIGISSSQSSVGSNSLPRIAGQNPRVKITGREDLTSWALHKHPQDIDIHDYRDVSVTNADIIIHREGGVNKVVKGAARNRILSDREVDQYIRDE
jgi:hypothetical protein